MVIQLNNPIQFEEFDLSDMYRQCVAIKIQQELQFYGIKLFTTSTEMESLVYQEAKNRDDYLIMISMILNHVKVMAKAKQKIKKAESLKIPFEPVMIPPGDTPQNKRLAEIHDTLSKLAVTMFKMKPI